MAEARTRLVQKTRTIEEEYTDVDGVILDLTHEETALLMFIVGHQISGGWRSKWRQLADGIYMKLHDLGYGYKGEHYHDVVQLEQTVSEGSGIIFKNLGGEF